MLGFKAAAFVLLAGPVWAQTPLSGPEFDAFTIGKAYAYARNGVTFGTEAYQPQQRVLWLGADGVCLAGEWFAQDGQICFVYDIDATGVPRVCVPIFASGQDLRAAETDGSEVTGLQSALPDLSACPDPQVGA